MGRIDNYDSAVMTDMTMVRQRIRIQMSMSRHLSVVVKDLHKKALSVKIGQMIMDSIISIRRIRLRGLQILHKSSKRFYIFWNLQNLSYWSIWSNPTLKKLFCLTFRRKFARSKRLYTRIRHGIFVRKWSKAIAGLLVSSYWYPLLALDFWCVWLPFGQLKNYFFQILGVTQGLDWKLIGLGECMWWLL